MSLPGVKTPNAHSANSVVQTTPDDRNRLASVLGFLAVLLFSMSIMGDKALPDLIESSGASLGRLLLPAMLLFIVTSRFRPAFGIHWLVTWLFIGFLSYYVQILTSNFVSINSSRAIVLFGSLSASFVAYQAIFQFINTRKRIQWLMTAYVLSVFIAYIYLSFSGNLVFAQNRLIASEGMNPNALGREIALAIILALILTTWGRRWMLLAIPILLWLLIQTGSRGALFALAPAVTVPIVLRSRAPRKRRVYFVVVILAVLSFEVLLNISNMETVERYANLSTDSRSSIALATLQLVSEHPLGVGFGQVEYALYEDYGYLIPYHLYVRFYDRIDTHNAYLYVLGDLGPLGLVVFLLAHWAVLRASLQTRKRDPQLGDAALMVAVFVLASGLSGSVLTLKYWWFGLGIASALAALPSLSDEQTVLGRERQSLRKPL